MKNSALAFLLFIATSAHAGPYFFYTSWGLPQNGASPSAEGNLSSPMGVAVGANGDIYVSDTSNRRVQVFSSEGQFITKWGKNGGDGTFGAGQGEFRNPRAIEVSANGTVFVGDSENYRVQVFSASGQFLSQFSSIWAEDLAIDAMGNVYIGEPNMTGKIRKYSPSGALLLEWATGAAPGGLAIDAFGNIYAAARPDNRIEKCSPEGQLLASWGGDGSGAGQLMDPRGIAIDSHGNAFVADSGNNRIQIFDADGDYLDEIGMPGSADGEFQLPYGIAIDTNDRLYVADAYNNRIQVFATQTAAEVPEPTTWALVVPSLIGLILGRRKGVNPSLKRRANSRPREMDNTLTM